MKKHSENKFADGYEFAYRKFLYPFYEGIIRQRKTLRYVADYVWGRDLGQLPLVQRIKSELGELAT